MTVRQTERITDIGSVEADCSVAIIAEADDDGVLSIGFGRVANCSDHTADLRFREILIEMDSVFVLEGLKLLAVA